MTYLCECGDVADDIFGVRNALDIDRLGLIVNGGSKRLGSRLSDPFYANAEVLEGHWMSREKGARKHREVE